MESILNIKNIDKIEVVENFLKYEKIKIKSLFIWTLKGYRQFASIYRCKKKDFSTKISAFLNLWLAGLIDLEEWNNNYVGSNVNIFLYIFANISMYNFILFFDF
jgi:hypothetical protein